MHKSLRSLAATTLAIFILAVTLPAAAQDQPDTKEVQAIAEEAYLYGIPMIVGYKVMHDFFIDTESSQFKSPIGQINNEARVFTPADTGISTPNR